MTELAQRLLDMFDVPAFCSLCGRMSTLLHENVLVLSVGKVNEENKETSVISHDNSGFAFRTLQGFGNNHSIGITLITNSRTHALLQRTAKQIDKPLFVYRVCHKQVLPGLQGQVRRELDICRGLSFASP